MHPGIKSRDGIRGGRMGHKHTVLATGLAVALAMAVSSRATAGQDSKQSFTYHKDIVPILQKNCQSCHRPGQIAPMSFLTYNDVRPWARAMKTAVITKKMPPWFAD